MARTMPGSGEVSCGRSERPATPELDELVQEIAELRPLRQSAVRVLALTEGERFSAQELAGAISADAVLSAKMLRLANSAYYGFPRKITTIRDAIVLLGFRAVRSAVLAAGMIEVLPGSNALDYERFWQFSVTVGMLAEIQARAIGRHLDVAFTAGVVHNIGRLALDQHRSSAFGEVLHLAGQGVSVVEAERRVLGFTEADLGGALALRWNFPDELVDAVANHALELKQLSDQQSLTACVVRARLFAHSLGVTDGVASERPESDDDSRWIDPSVSAVLKEGGGVDGVMERVDSFMEHTVGV